MSHGRAEAASPEVLVNVEGMSLQPRHSQLSRSPSFTMRLQGVFEVDQQNGERRLSHAQFYRLMSKSTQHMR